MENGTLRALCVRQPYAGLIACGIKTVEVRSWQTAHRGPLVIIASSSLATESADTLGLSREDRKALPRCTAVAIVDVVAVVPMRRSHAPRACCDHNEFAYAWELTNARPVVPSNTRGRLNLFSVPQRLIQPLPVDGWPQWLLSLELAARRAVWTANLR